MSNSYKSSSLAPSTTHSNVSVLTTCINHILLNPLFILPDFEMMGELRMFDNLTSINFSLVSVRQTRRRYAAESHGVCCRVQKKPNSGLIQADSG